MYDKKSDGKAAKTSARSAQETLKLPSFTLFLLLTGKTTAGTAVFSFFLPVLAGNIAGGTAVFTLMAWGQVRDELDEEE